MMNRTRRVIAVLFIVSVVACLTVSSGSPAQKEVPTKGLPKSIIYSVPPVGGVLYTSGAGVATVIGRYIESKVIVQSFPGLVQVADSVAKGQTQLASLNPADVYLCSNGMKDYEKWGPRRLRTLGRGDSSSMAFFTTPATGIKRIQDLVGKKVAYISAVSAEGTLALKLMLEYYNIVDKVTALPRGGLEQTVNSMVEGRIDAYGAPVGGHIDQLKAAKGVVVVPVPREVVEYIQLKAPLQFRVPERAPKGLYGLPEDVDVVSGLLILFTNSNCSEELAYAMTKAVHDHQQELAAIHRSCGNFNLDRFSQFPSPVAYHPGAIKYFKEKGVWTKAFDDLQRKLLAEEGKGTL